MAVPKNRISKARKGKRRTHKKLDEPGLNTCSHCNQPKMPHRACPNCGYYGGRMVAVPKER